MKLSNKVSVLGELGIIDWLQGGEGDAHVRILVNAIASDYYFEDVDYIAFAPGHELSAVRTHFEECGYPIDWYSLITLEFAESIKFDPQLCVLYGISPEPMRLDLPSVQIFEGQVALSTIHCLDAILADYHRVFCNQ